MSAFLQSGRFYHGETPIFRVRFRPEADIHYPFRLIGARVKLTDEKLGEN